MDTIRINLVDYTTSEKHVDFLASPVTNEKDFACVPAGILPLQAVVLLSQQVKAGRVFGATGKYLWYRLKETTAGKHKSPMGGQQGRAPLRRYEIPAKSSARR